MKPMVQVPLKDDPVWQDALDWLMRVQAVPEDPAILAARDAWMAEDDHHARAYHKAERVWRLSGDLAPSIPLPRSPAVPPRQARRLRPVGRRAAMAVAACLALAVAVPALWGSSPPSHATGRAETKAVALADGSSLHLDAASAASTDLSADARGVVLHRGQAFFDVVSDPARPFTVTAGPVSVTVVGTSFSVGKDTAEISVAVRSGAVRVTPGPGQAEEALAPGDRLVIRRSDGTVERRRVTPQAVAAWRDGRLVVEEATVAEVIARLRPHFRGAIVLRDEVLATRRITGIFDLKDPANALRAALGPHGGTVQEWPFLLVAGRG